MLGAEAAFADNRKSLFSVFVCGSFNFTEGFNLVSPSFCVEIVILCVSYLDVVAHTYNLSTIKAEAGGSLIDESQSGLSREIQVSQQSRATL
jgi:hypothetical protein